MKPSQLLISVLLAGAALPSMAAETCEVMRKVDGVLKGVQVPCSQVKRPTTPEQEAALKADRDELAAKKRQCGKDFEALRIGMLVARFEQCTDGLVYVTDTVTKEGTFTTYRSKFYLIQTAGGKIVAYSRL